MKQQSAYSHHPSSLSPELTTPHRRCRGCGLEWWTALDDVARFCEFGAVQLRSLRLTSNMPNFAGVQPWLELMPSLRELTLSCDTKDDVGVDSEEGGFDARAPMAMRAAEGRAGEGVYALEELTLSGELVEKGWGRWDGEADVCLVDYVQGHACATASLGRCQTSKSCACKQASSSMSPHRD